MKSKDKVALLEEVLLKGCFETSVLMGVSTGGEKDFAFAVNENPSRKLADGSTVFGLVVDVIIKQEGKQPEYKKLFDRSYKTQNRKLTEVKEQAYTELLDIIIATFLISAYKTPAETLQEASNLK